MGQESGANLIVTLLEPFRAPITMKQIMVTMTKSSKPKQMPGLFQTSQHSSLNLQTHVLLSHGPIIESLSFWLHFQASQGQ